MCTKSENELEIEIEIEPQGQVEYKQLTPIVVDRDDASK